MGLVCSNVRGLNSNEKKRRLITALKLRNIDIAIITDSCINSNEVNTLKQDVNYDCIHTERLNAINASRGVVILWKRKSLITVTPILQQDDGNLLLVKATIGERSLLICGIYGPNEDAPEFFRNLDEALIEHNETDVIICGDFNVTMNHSADNEGYVMERN